MTMGILTSLAQMAGERQAELDGSIAGWRAETGKGLRLWCGPGCGNCCTLSVNATLPEALAIAATLDSNSEERLVAKAARVIDHARHCSDARGFLAGYREAVGPCPFLDDTANCTIYRQRPLACRALLSTRPAGWCGVNLGKLPEIERDAFLASLDPTVVAYPTHYAAVPRELAADFERGLVFTMVRFIGFGVTGNLSLLVWLCGLPDFAAALCDGAGPFRAFLDDRRIRQPFLVQTVEP